MFFKRSTYYISVFCRIATSQWHRPTNPRCPAVVPVKDNRNTDRCVFTCLCGSLCKCVYLCVCVYFCQCMYVYLHLRMWMCACVWWGINIACFQFLSAKSTYKAFDNPGLKENTFNRDASSGTVSQTISYHAKHAEHTFYYFEYGYRGSHIMPYNASLCVYSICWVLEDALCKNVFLFLVGCFLLERSYICRYCVNA